MGGFDFGVISLACLICGCSEGEVLVGDVSFVMVVVLAASVVLFMRYLGLRGRDLERRRGENQHFLHTMYSLNKSESLVGKDGKSSVGRGSSKKHR